MGASRFVKLLTEMGASQFVKLPIVMGASQFAKLLIVMGASRLGVADARVTALVRCQGLSDVT